MAEPQRTVLTFLPLVQNVPSAAVSSLFSDLALSRPTVPHNVSTEVLPANSNRTSGGLAVNNTNFMFYVNFGVDAAIGQGYPLSPGMVIDIPTQQAVYAIQSSGSSLELDVFEATEAS